MLYGDVQDRHILEAPCCVSHHPRRIQNAELIVMLAFNQDVSMLVLMLY